MASLSSKVLFGIGVALAVAAISSIFVSMVVTQAQQGGAQSSGGSTSTAGSQGAQSQSGGQQQGSGGASQQGGGTQQSQQGGGGATQITIAKGSASQQVQQFYQPDPAQVSPNSKVTWQNMDSAPHTATADDGSFDTGNIAPGQSGSATISGQGKIAYSCTIHPFMKATLQVAAGGSQQGSAQTAQSGSQQQAAQNQSQGTQTAASQDNQTSGGTSQALQQAGQALIQAGNALQQASGGTSTAQQPSGQQQAPQSQQQSSTQGAQQAGGATTAAQAPQQSQTQQQSSSGQQGSANSNATSQPQQSGQGSTQTASSSQADGGNINQTLQQVAQLLSQASSALQQAVGGGSQAGQATTQQSDTQQSGAAQSAGGSQQQSQNASQQTQTASQQSSGGQQSQQGGTTDQIDIPQGAQQGPQYYSPSNAQVSPGSKVTWNNKDSVAHTATAQDGSFDTGNIAPGSSGSATIQGQGQIQYYCTIHPWMTGTLNVGGSGGTQQGNQQSQGRQQEQQQSAQGGQQSGGAAQAGGQQQGGAQQQQQGQTSAAGAGQQQGGGGQTSAEGFPIRMHATAFEVLPKSADTDTGLEPEHKDDWVTANHDIHYTRTSEQTTISKDNVDKLQVKWILNSDFPIENPPLIIGDKGYAQDNAMRVIAFDANTGLNLWKFDPGVADKQNQQLPRGVFSHGITYDHGVIFAPTGANGTVVALNATDGDLLWQSASIGDPRLGYRLPMPPIVWKDYVIAGSALGDEPPFAPAAKGSITAFNRTNGEKIWNISTVTGAWVEGENAKKNGGATIWSGGSFDPGTGIMYLPTGNAAPDFNATSRPPPNKYTSSIIAVDIKNGQILWDTQSVSPTDEHDWDTAWGTSLATAKTDNGDTMKVVIAQNKRGEGFALNAADGSVLWNKTIGVEYRTGAQPTPYGSGEVWPGANYGIEDYNANDNKTAYFAASNMGFNYFTNQQGTSGHLKPVFDAIENGIGNGTITAVDIATGKIKWEYPTEFPTWVSPAVTNGVVFSGHITAPGKPYEFGDFGAPTETPLLPSGIVLALDKDTGKKLWEFNVGAPIGIGGPSIGNGMLYVTTGSPAEMGSNKGGYIVAFGLPDDAGNQTITSSAQPAMQNATSAGNATAQENSDEKSHQPAAPDIKKQKVG